MQMQSLSEQGITQQLRRILVDCQCTREAVMMEQREQEVTNQLLCTSFFTSFFVQNTCFH